MCDRQGQSIERFLVARMRPADQLRCADGQVHGGVAQGIGNALLEKFSTTKPATSCRRRWPIIAADLAEIR